VAFATPGRPLRRAAESLSARDRPAHAGTPRAWPDRRCGGRGGRPGPPCRAPPSRPCASSTRQWARHSWPGASPPVASNAGVMGDDARRRRSGRTGPRASTDGAAVANLARGTAHDDACRAQAGAAQGCGAPEPPAESPEPPCTSYGSCSRTCLSRCSPAYWSSCAYSSEPRDHIVDRPRHRVAQASACSRATRSARSLMITSTPSPARRRIVASSLTVKTPTAIVARCAASTTAASQSE
jgi:hypothetical protein